MNQTYTTFLRTCNNWKEFASAEKITQETGLTYAEAYEACKEYNANRTEDQIFDGTKMEFIAE